MCVHWILMEADLYVSNNQKYPLLNTFCIVFKHCDIRLQCSGIKLNHANHASSHGKLGFIQFECGKYALNTLEKIQFKCTLIFFLQYKHPIVVLAIILLI